MSTFQPTTITLDPPPDHDPRGTALVTALRRHLGYKLTMSLPVALVVALATAGLAPLVILLVRFRNFGIGEWFQLEHVSEWMNHEQAAGEPAVPRRRATGLFIDMGMVLAAVAFGIAVAHLVAMRSPLHLWTFFPFMRPSITAAAYPVVLGLGFVSMLAAIFLEQFSVRRLAERLQFAGVSIKNVGEETLTTWSICGVVLLVLGCGWGLPMMLAAGAHRRYINVVSRDVRAQIADRIEQMRGRDAHATGS